MRTCGVVLALLLGCGKGGDPPAAGTSTPPAPPPAVDPLRAVVVTEVPARVRVEPLGPRPPVIVTATEVILEGHAFARVEGGTVADAELAKLTAAAKAAARDRFEVAIAPGLSSALAVRVLGALGGAPLALVVRTPDGPGALPVWLTDGLVARESSVDLVLELTPERATVWSRSGQEGTRAEPRLDVAIDADGRWRERVRDDLASVADRRWRGTARPANDRRITIAARPEVSTGEAIAAAVMVRHTAAGDELFPEVMLATETAPKPVAVAKPDDRATIEEEAARYAAALAAVDPDSSSIASMTKIAPGADLDQQIRDVQERGADVAVGGLSTSRGGTGRVVGMGDGPTVGDTPPAPAARIVVTGATALDESSLDADLVRRKVQSVYMAGLKRCYQHQLKTDPTAAGQLRVRFTVREIGIATSPEVTAPTDEIASCVRAAVAGWRFGKPLDDQGEATTASFELVLVLRPE